VRIPGQRRYTGRKAVCDSTEIKMVEEYKAGVPVAEIAKKYTCSQATVTRTMKRWNVPQRNVKASF
jgi:Mor family transcriptional regulator